MGEVLPYDQAHEQAVIGSMLLWPEGAEQALSIMSPSDFYVRSFGEIFDAFGRCHRSGLPLELLSISAELDRMGIESGHRQVLAEALAAAPISRNIERYCALVIDAKARRSLVSIGIELAEAARENTADAAELLQGVRERLESVDVESTTFMPDGLSTMEGFLNRPEDEHKPWAIPGLLRIGHRVVIVATEGAGKSVLLRQIAIAAAAGEHPLTHRPIPAVRTLVVDWENPDDAVEEVCAPMHALAERGDDWDPDRCWLWRQPSGVDLRKRRDRVEFESVLRASRPDLVCIGPAYKGFRSGSGDVETATAEFQEVLDDLRTRHGFALIVEHHAPRGDSSRQREIRPHGSVLWERWPEIGLAMLPIADRPGSFDLGRWRGDRVKSSWPERLDRSGHAWPWEGLWPKGTFTADVDEPVEQF